MQYFFTICEKFAKIDIIFQISCNKKRHPRAGRGVNLLDLIVKKHNGRSCSMNSKKGLHFKSPARGSSIITFK